MAFPESLKRRLRARAHFACCLCFAKGVEIHHIIPREQGGPDTAHNAAPLCPSCHETYGDNPKKRKFIREARDAWYEIRDSRFRPNLPSTLAAYVSDPVRRGRGSSGPNLTPDELAAELLTYAFAEVNLPSTDWSSVESLLSIFNRLQFWPGAEWRSWRTLFLRAYGSRVAGRLLLQLMLEDGIVLGGGFSRKAFISVLTRYRIVAMLLGAPTRDPDLGVEFSFRSDRHLVMRLPTGTGDPAG